MTLAFEWMDPNGKTLFGSLLGTGSLVAIGSILGIAAIVAVVLYLRKKKSDSKGENDDE